MNVVASVGSLIVPTIKSEVENPLLFKWNLILFVESKSEIMGLIKNNSPLLPPEL